jgi:hypothetical protein
MDAHYFEDLVKEVIQLGQKDLTELVDFFIKQAPLDQMFIAGYLGQYRGADLQIKVCECLRCMCVVCVLTI